MHLGLGLRRSLICFAPLAFVPQCQESPRCLPSLLVFLTISTHFTATPLVPTPPKTLNPDSIAPHSKVEPWYLKRDFSGNLRYSLRPINPDNVCALRITATAGT